MRKLKLAVAAACLTFSAGVLYTHLTNTLFPGLPVGTAVAAVVLFSGVYLDRHQPTLGIAVLVVLALAYRLYSFAFPASMMRFDPDAHAVGSKVIMLTGDLSELVDTFYQIVALFKILGAEAALITGTRIDTAYSIFPVIVALCMPLFAAVLARRVSMDTRAPVVAAAVAAAGASSVKYSTGPVPLTLAAVYLAGFVMVMTFAYHDFDWQILVTLGIFASAAAFTHKIPLLLLIGVAVVLTVYSGIYEQVKDRTVSNLGPRIAVFSTLFVVLQWFYVTVFIEDAVYQIFGLLGLVGTSVNLTTPAAAALVDPPLPVKLRNLSYFFITTSIAALAGAELFRRAGNRNVRIVQSAAVVTVGISVPGLFLGSAPGFQRIFVYATAFVSTLVGVGISRFAKAEFPSTRSIAAFTVIVILIVNPMSVTATPDFPGTPREYLTADEVGGKVFSNQYIDEVVYMDLFYGDETVDFGRAARGANYQQQTVPSPELHPGLLSRELTEGTLLQQNYQYIALRTDVDVYRLAGGRYRLTWQPEQALNKSQSYQRIYSNGGVAIYRNA